MSTRLLIGDCRDVLPTLPPQSVHCVVTSPPYFGLRDYGVAGQIGLEGSLDAYITTLVDVFREVRRVLRDDGTVWLNLGDSYANDTKWGGATGGKHVNGLHGSTGIGRQKVTTGLKAKDLMMVPARVAIALCDDGWYLRSDIIWAKKAPMPESCRDRPTSAHEHVFLLTKQPRYFYDQIAVAEPGVEPERQRLDRIGGSNGHTVRHSEGGMIGPSATRNLRNVWHLGPSPFSGVHFATFPPALVEPCIKAGSPVGGTVLDPFAGTGTVGLVADRLGRHSILIELNPTYAAMSRRRIVDDCPMFTQVTTS